MKEIADHNQVLFVMCFSLYISIEGYPELCIVKFLCLWSQFVEATFRLVRFCHTVEDAGAKSPNATGTTWIVVNPAWLQGFFLRSLFAGSTARVARDNGRHCLSPSTICAHNVCARTTQPASPFAVR